MGNASTAFSRRTTVLILAAMVLTITVSRARFYDWSAGRDESIYAVTTHELLAGRRLYSDVWLDRAPAIFATYAFGELLVGYNQGIFFFLGTLATLIVLFGVYCAASSAGRGPPAGLWAAGIWTIISGDIASQANGANTEPFINACLVWADDECERNLVGN